MTDRILAGDPAYNELFTQIERSWFRLETFQHYASEEDLVRKVAAGEPLPREDGPWYEMLRAHTAAGRALRRVHIIEEPHSPYIAFELLGYRDTTAAGEDVRIVPTPAGVWPPGLPRHDFWIFDEDQLWVMYYDDSGALEAVERVTDPSEVAQHQRWAEAAWQAAVPWATYLADAGLLGRVT
jgi:hypothetical protein